MGECSLLLSPSSLTPTRDGSCHRLCSASENSTGVSKPQAWIQPFHPAPAEDLSLNPDLKLQTAVIEGFPLSSSQSETFHQNPEVWRALCHPLCQSNPSPLCSSSGADPACMETSGIISIAKSLQGRVFLAQCCAPEQFILLAPGFYPALAAHRGLQRTRSQFQISPVQPHVQELLLLLFPRKQRLTLVSFM